jgi:ubiquinone biosynthesis protein COQ4
MNSSVTAMDTRLHPLTAIAAVRALQANPEDTRQIFVIFRALRGRSGINAFAGFQASETGRRVLADRRVLLDVLSDRAYLASLPEGSVGRAYLAFMDAEKLSADGLVMASQDWEQEKAAPPK